MDKWISVEDRLPEEDGEKVLIYLGDGRMASAEIAFPFDNPNSYMWYSFGEVEFDDFEVSHWMPLPAPPTTP